MVVGHPLCRPHGTNLGTAAANDFHLPHLFFVGNGDALAAVGISVFLYQLGDKLDGLARCGAALQGDALQLLDEEHRIGILKRIGTAEGALADGQLLLV